MKIKVTTEDEKRLKLILKSKLNGKNNQIQAINTWADWKVDELKKWTER